MTRLPLKWPTFIATLLDSSQWVASTTQRGMSTCLNTPHQSTTVLLQLSKSKLRPNGNLKNLTNASNTNESRTLLPSRTVLNDCRPRIKQLTTFADSRDVAQYSTFHLKRSRDCSKLGVKIGIPIHYLIISVPDSAHYEELSTIFVPEFVNDMTCGGILCYFLIFRYL
jgi:hypothetical protein